MSLREQPIHGQPVYSWMPSVHLSELEIWSFFLNIHPCSFLFFVMPQTMNFVNFVAEASKEALQDLTLQEVQDLAAQAVARELRKGRYNGSFGRFNMTEERKKRDMQIYLMRMQGRTFREIGQIMDVTPGRAGQIYHALMKRMVAAQSHKFRTISQRNQYIKMQVTSGQRVSTVAQTFQLSPSRVREIVRTAY